MKTEIERKFLVVDDSWRPAAGDGLLCRQGYISSGPTVRVRLMGGQGFLTLKGPTRGISRPELEYEIPAEEAVYMLENFCGDRVVEKIRFIVEIAGNQWEVDVFSGANEGLVMAEIELESEDQPFEKPAWVGEEVSHDGRYFNSALARNPFANW